MTQDEKAVALTDVLVRLCGGDKLKVIWKPEHKYVDGWQREQTSLGYFQIRGPYDYASSAGKDGLVAWGTFGTAKSTMSYCRGWLAKWVIKNKYRWEN